MKNFIKKTSLLFPHFKAWLSLPAFTGMLALSLGIIVSDKLPLLSTVPLYNNSIIYSIIILLLFIIIFRNRTIRIILFIVSGFLLHSSHIQKENLFYKDLNKVLAANNCATVTGRVLSSPVFSKQKYTFLLASDLLFSNNDTLKMHGKAVKCLSEISPPAYGTITCIGNFKPPRKPANPYAFDEYTHFLANRIWGRLDVNSLISVKSTNSFISSAFLKIRTTALKTITHVNDIRIQGILQAALLGENENLTADMKYVFRESGIYHLLAISGLHVGILIVSVLLLLSIIPVSKTVKILITVIFIWCYLFFIGLIPSLFRAVVMATIILLSFIFQRKNHAVNSLGFAGIIWLIMSPKSLVTPGFQLSFAATFGIITLFPVLKNHLMPEFQNPVVNLSAKTILNPFFISLAGFISTQPILIYHFGRISLLGLIVNIFAVFLMSIAMNIFFAGIIAQALWEPFSILLMKISEFFLGCIIKSAELSYFIPYSSINIPVPYPEFFIIYCLVFIGFASIDKNHMPKYIQWILPVIFLITPAIVLCRNLNSRSEITIFSTEKESLTGIRFPNRKIWLIGTLNQEPSGQLYRNIIDPWLRHFMFKKFDAIVLPSVDMNIVHSLDPIFSDIKSNLVIHCNKIQYDDLFKNNFKSFLTNNNVNDIETENGWQFIPADKCTCVIYCDKTDQQLNEKCESAKIKISFADKTQFYYNFSNIEIKHFKPEREMIRVNDNIALTFPDISHNKILYLKQQEKAIRIKLRGSGIWKVE